MKSRKEVVKLINQQLANESPAQATKNAWHYGKQELMELLDFIFDGEPGDDEKL